MAERLTLNEAIKHCEEKTDCTQCGEEHRQLAEWLKELQHYKDLEEQGYKMANIDKVVEQLEEMSVTFCREYGYAEDENVLYLPDAIKIVKKGGAE